MHQPTLTDIAYPLEINFKIISIARQLSLRDARGRMLFYVKQKAFKLKEEVIVYADETQQQDLFTMRADRMIDFSAAYHLSDTRGHTLGAIKRQGMRSLWKAHYEVADAGGQAALSIHEENVWTKVFDSLLGEIPVIGMFTGYFFHPAYLVTRSDGATVLRMVKQPALFEGKFLIEKLGVLDSEQEQLALLSLAMMILLERSRG